MADSYVPPGGPLPRASTLKRSGYSGRRAPPAAAGTSSRHSRDASHVSDSSVNSSTVLSHAIQTERTISNPVSPRTLSGLTSPTVTGSYAGYDDAWRGSERVYRESSQSRGFGMDMSAGVPVTRRASLNTTTTRPDKIITSNVGAAAQPGPETGELTPATPMQRQRREIFVPETEARKSMSQRTDSVGSVDEAQVVVKVGRRPTTRRVVSTTRRDIAPGVQETVEVVETTHTVEYQQQQQQTTKIVEEVDVKVSDKASEANESGMIDINFDSPALKPSLSLGEKLTVETSAVASDYSEKMLLAVPTPSQLVQQQVYTLQMPSEEALPVYTQHDERAVSPQLHSPTPVRAVSLNSQEVIDVNLPEDDVVFAAPADDDEEMAGEWNFQSADATSEFYHQDTQPRRSDSLYGVGVMRALSSSSGLPRTVTPPSAHAPPPAYIPATKRRGRYGHGGGFFNFGRGTVEVNEKAGGGLSRQNGRRGVVRRYLLGTRGCCFVTILVLLSLITTIFLLWPRVPSLDWVVLQSANRPLSFNNGASARNTTGTAAQMSGDFQVGIQLTNNNFLDWRPRRLVLEAYEMSSGVLVGRGEKSDDVTGPMRWPKLSKANETISSVSFALPGPDNQPLGASAASAVARFRDACRNNGTVRVSWHLRLEMHGLDWIVEPIRTLEQELLPICA